MPLTRSVSTATELFEFHNKSNNHCHDDLGRTSRYGTLRSNSNHHLNQNAANVQSMCRAGSTASIHSNNYHNNNAKRAKSKDELFSEFCERAGRRYTAPKEIYFIDPNADDLHRYDERAADYEQMMHKARRSSMGTSSAVMRNSNLYASNSSLHKSYPKNLFDLEQRNESNHNKLKHPQKNYHHSSSNRSSDSRHWHEPNEYSSQTLPRDFLKRNVEFDAFLQNGNARLCEEQQFKNNPRQRLTYDDKERTYGIKSQENLMSTHRTQRVSHGSQDDILNWPNAIPASPSGYSRAQFHIRHGSLYVGSEAKETPTRKLYPPNGGYEHNSGRREAPMGQQQQARQSPDGDFGTFDLDRIETERRKSHASLFESSIDYENGTAV